MPSRTRRDPDPHDTNHELVEDIAELVVKRMQQLWSREKRRIRREMEERSLFEDYD